MMDRESNSGDPGIVGEFREETKLRRLRAGGGRSTSDRVRGGERLQRSLSCSGSLWLKIMMTAYDAAPLASTPRRSLLTAGR